MVGEHEPMLGDEVEPMTALAKDRRTAERSGDLRQPDVKEATRIYAGALVAIGNDGLAVPMTTSKTLRGLGRGDGAGGGVRRHPPRPLRRGAGRPQLRGTTHP